MAVSPKKPALSKKVLSEHLRALATEVTAWDATEQEGISRAELLAKALWQRALGWTETVIDDAGEETTVVHPPQTWAMQFVFERLEGRAPQSEPEKEHRVTAAERVRELAKKKLNSLAASAIMESFDGPDGTSDNASGE